MEQWINENNDKYKPGQFIAIIATKHKPVGLVEIADEEHSDYCQFSISDNGKGIAKRYQEDLKSLKTTSKLQVLA